jgi:hypothetical protein
MPPESPTFFVDYELGSGESGAPHVGFAFRAGERVLGDSAVEVEVRAVLDALMPILRHDGDRRDDALFALPLEALLPRLEVGVFVYSDPGIDAGSDWKRFVRFVVLPRQCNTFHGWSAYLVENELEARLVWRDPWRGQLGEARLALGEMEAALRAFCVELEASLEKPHSVMPRSGERLRSDAAIEVPPSARRRGANG